MCRFERQAGRVFVRDVGHGGGCVRHSDLLRARERPAHGLHAGHETLGRLDALGCRAG